MIINRDNKEKSRIKKKKIIVSSNSSGSKKRNGPLFCFLFLLTTAIIISFKFEKLNETFFFLKGIDILGGRVRTRSVDQRVENDARGRHGTADDGRLR